MDTLIVSKDKFEKVLGDFEILIKDVASFLNQDDIVKNRIKEINNNLTIDSSEDELDAYLKKRGVQVE
ncbi:hypothetical protein COU57_00995 [Candidatus Pacearchaeota archaeon CG10_big_fil_rev_8_21_14_0_10_32_14]|nr:MAG: hypothetical protein COU57_00995 [Candidatus Pacearchaeota archaeon CG10_big_fil_rev_8_21_14_0_10_32_14]